MHLRKCDRHPLMPGCPAPQIPCGFEMQGYELVQGALVRWTEHRAASRPPPTAVLVHGILGSRRNMVSFANRLVEVRPLPHWTWNSETHRALDMQHLMSLLWRAASQLPAYTLANCARLRDT